jgi:hypothetical protein
MQDREFQARPRVLLRRRGGTLNQSAALRRNQSRRQRGRNRRRAVADDAGRRRRRHAPPRGMTQSVRFQQPGRPDYGCSRDRSASGAFVSTARTSWVLPRERTRHTELSPQPVTSVSAYACSCNAPSPRTAGSVKPAVRFPCPTITRSARSALPVPALDVHFGKRRLLGACFVSGRGVASAGVVGPSGRG